MSISQRLLLCTTGLINLASYTPRNIVKQAMVVRNFLIIFAQAKNIVITNGAVNPEDTVVNTHSLTALVLYPVGTGSKKGSLLKNNISPPKNRVTPPAFGKILNRIQIYPAHTLSHTFSLSIEIFRRTRALLTDNFHCVLMSMMVNRRKTAKKDGLEQFQIATNQI